MGVRTRAASQYPGRRLDWLQRESETQGTGNPQQEHPHEDTSLDSDPEPPFWGAWDFCPDSSPPAPRALDHAYSPHSPGPVSVLSEDLKDNFM